MTVQNSPTDADLLGLMQAGDEEAFVALYRRRQAGVYRFALQMCGSAAVAEDVTQEVFMALMRDGARHFDPARGTLAGYLYGIARHQVLRALARDKAYVQLGDGDEADAELHASHQQSIMPSDVLGDLTRGETIERVRQSVLALPAHYREVVVLCDLHEMSYADAASALDCAVGTVRSRLHRARGLLVEKLRDAAAKENTVAVSTEEKGTEETGARNVKTTRCFA